MCQDIWSRTRDFGTYRICEQRREQTRQSLHFSYTQSKNPDEDSDQNLDLTTQDMSNLVFLLDTFAHMLLQ